MIAPLFRGYGVLATAGIWLLIGSAASAAPTGKIEICHKPGAHNQRILFINEDKGAPDHFGHGDHVVSAEMCDSIPNNNCDDVQDDPVADDADCVADNDVGWTCQSGMCVAPPNAPPTDIALDNTSVDENQPAGTTVGNFTTTDADAADTHTYTLVAGAGDTDNAQFAIVGDQLQTAAVLDFENTANCLTSVNTCSIRVKTDDGNGGMFPKSFIINIGNVNDDPTDIALDNSSVDENEPAGTTVGNFTTTDDDTADTHTYTLVAGAGDTDNAQFAIVGDQLRTAAVLDFETAANCTTSASTCSIRVQTDDGNGGVFQESFIINIGNVNEAPTDIALDSTDVDENQAVGTAVGTLSTTDADSAGPFVYTLVAGAGDTDNAQFAIVGDQLQTAAVFDFDVQNSFSIRVQTDDGAGNTFEEAFLITVNDLNVAPTDMALDSTDVDEGLASGAVVGTLATTDADSAGPFVYTLVAGAGDTDNAAFAIVGDQLQTAAVFDFDVQNSFSIRVQTDDGAGGTFQEVFSITVNEVTNVAPEPMDDLYNTAIGNTNFALVAALSGTSSPPTVQVVGSVLDNDSDPDAGDALSVTADASVPTTMGGSVAIDADGRFVYTPAAGLPNATADSFIYEICDDAATPLCADGMVHITGAGTVWYVDDSSPNNPGTGTAADPFRDLSSAEVASLMDETIFVYAGTQSGGITLKANQQLLGEGVALVIDTITLVNAGTRPVLGPTGTAIALASDNTVRGFDISVTGGSQGLVGSGFGIATINEIAITTQTGTGLNLNNGNATATIDSITSTSAGGNSAIALFNTGTGAITVNGGTIANKTVDAITFNDTDGPITLANMIIQDIGDMAGGFNTRSQDDAIHGHNVNGGLTLDGMTIRRISDMCVNGALFTDGISPTVWNGLDILNSTIDSCNRWHIAGNGDTSNEGAVRIVGLTGNVTIDNSIIRRGGELFDLFTHSSGTLTMSVTNSNFEDAFKEFTSGPVVAIGKFCIDVTVEGSSDANVIIGGAGVGNTFINCGTASLRVSKDTVPAGSSDIVYVVSNNSFRVTDQTSANGVFGNTPQGGVALRAGPGMIGTFDAIVSNNTFGVAVGPDDDIGSTTDEVANADGVPGNVALIFESGMSRARVNNNTFNGSINAPWFNRADNVSGTQISAAVLYENNSYRGRADYCCDAGFTFRVPGIPYRTRVRNGGKLDISFVNDSFALHDQFFFAQTENLEFESRLGGGTMCVSLNNTTSPDGYEFDELIGTINLYQGAVNNAATGPCGVAATSDCQNELADDGVRGGPNGYSQTGAPNAALNPPFVDIDNGSVTITGTACTVPSGGIF